MDATTTPAPGRTGGFAPENLTPEARQAEARRFLDTLDPTAREFCFQTFDDLKDRKDPKKARTLHGLLPELWATLDRLNQQGAGIFVTVNSVTPGQPRTAENVDRVRAVFADFDPPKTNPAPERYPLPPTMRVESSPGKEHAYWLVSGLPLDEFTAQQQAISDALGSDPVPKDLPRVMRLPGFFHMKDAAHPHLVRIIAEVQP